MRCAAPLLRGSRNGLLSKSQLSYRYIPRSRITTRQKSTAVSDAATESSRSGANGGSPQTPKPNNAEAQSPGAGPTAMSIWDRRLGPVMNALRKFDRYQARRPLVVQLFASLTVYFFGDLMAQKIEGSEYDPKRTIRNMIIGGIISAPGYKWFIFLSQHFNYSSRMISMGTKVVINQLCFTPAFSTTFFGLQALLAGQSLDDAIERVKKAVPITWVNSLKLWPAVTVVTFTFVPMQYRFMVSGVIAVFWQGYLSWLNQREAKKSQLLHEIAQSAIAQPS